MFINYNITLNKLAMKIKVARSEPQKSTFLNISFILKPEFWIFGNFSGGKLYWSHIWWLLHQNFESAQAPCSFSSLKIWLMECSSQLTPCATIILSACFHLLYFLFIKKFFTKIDFWKSKDIIVLTGKKISVFLLIKEFWM